MWKPYKYNLRSTLTIIQVKSGGKERNLRYLTLTLNVVQRYSECALRLSTLLTPPQVSHYLERHTKDRATVQRISWHIHSFVARRECSGHFTYINQHSPLSVSLHLRGRGNPCLHAWFIINGGVAVAPLPSLVHIHNKSIADHIAKSNKAPDSLQGDLRYSRWFNSNSSS